MRRDDLILFTTHRLTRALKRGEPSPLSKADISCLLGFEIEIAQGLSSDALLFLTEGMSAAERYLLGLSLAHFAVDLQCDRLGDRAATLLITATDSCRSLEGPDLVDILQRLLRLKKIPA